MNCCNDYVQCKHGHGCPIPTLTEVHAFGRAKHNPPAKEETMVYQPIDEVTPNKAAWHRQQMIAMAQEPYQTSHVLHFFVSLFTGGLWAIAWLVIALRNRTRRRQIALRFGWAE